MVREDLTFFGSQVSETTNHELKVYVNGNNKIFISISDPGYLGRFICLDVKTAIRFSKELRKSINQIKQNGGN